MDGDGSGGAIVRLFKPKEALNAFIRQVQIGTIQRIGAASGREAQSDNHDTTAS